MPDAPKAKRNPCEACGRPFLARVRIDGELHDACARCYWRHRNGYDFWLTGEAQEAVRAKQTEWILANEGRMTDDEMAAMLKVSRHTILRRRKKARGA